MNFAAPQKISDVERELARLREQYGDVDVVVFAPDWRGRNDWRPVQVRIGEHRPGRARIVKIEG